MKNYSLFLRIECPPEEADELKSLLTIPNASYELRPPRREHRSIFICDIVGKHGLDTTNLEEALHQLRNLVHNYEHEIANLKWDKTLWCACFSDNSFETTIRLDADTIAWLCRINASIQVTTYYSEEP